MHGCNSVVIKEKKDLSVTFFYRQGGQNHEGSRLTQVDFGLSFFWTNSYQ